jgi:hypothetical protein
MDQPASRLCRIAVETTANQGTAETFALLIAEVAGQAPRHDKATLSGAVSPDGRPMVMGSQGGATRLRNLAAGEELSSLNGRIQGG